MIKEDLHMIINVFLTQIFETDEIVTMKHAEKISYIHNFEWDLNIDRLKIWNKEFVIEIRNINNVIDEENQLTLITSNGIFLLEEW